MSNQRVLWCPVLEGMQAARARALVENTAEILASQSLSIPGLGDGLAGHALLFAYLGETWPDRGYGERAEDHLARAVDIIGEQPLGAGLYSGFTGVAWAVEHLRDLSNADADPNLAIDEALHDYLQTSPWPGPYDLIAGLAGFAAYALERLPRPSAIENLRLVVARLKEISEARDGGLTWLSHAASMQPTKREECPTGYYNLGVAHGVPGVIAILAAACEAGVAVDDARPLLDGAWRWMMANRLPPERESAFPHWIRPDRTPRDSRSAWCYGDPGAATAMYMAARAVGNDAWAAAALEIARRATARPFETCGVVDAGLCHGAAGLAQLYNRLWQTSGEMVFADAARRWYEVVLELHRPGHGVGWQSRGEHGLVEEEGFLIGAGGIVLALLAAIGNVEPAWDRVLLASLRRDVSIR